MMHPHFVTLLTQPCINTSVQRIIGVAETLSGTGSTDAQHDRKCWSITWQSPRSSVKIISWRLWRASLLRGEKSFLKMSNVIGEDVSGIFMMVHNILYTRLEARQETYRLVSPLWYRTNVFLPLTCWILISESWGWRNTGQGTLLHCWPWSELLHWSWSWSSSLQLETSSSCLQHLEHCCWCGECWSASCSGPWSLTVNVLVNINLDTETLFSLTRKSCYFSGLEF